MNKLNEGSLQCWDSLIVHHKKAPFFTSDSGKNGAFIHDLTF